MAQTPFKEIRAISSDGQTIQAFLSFPSKDVENDPGKLRAFSPELAGYIASLTKGVTFDPDETVEGDIEL